MREENVKARKEHSVSDGDGVSMEHMSREKFKSARGKQLNLAKQAKSSLKIEAPNSRLG